MAIGGSFGSGNNFGTSGFSGVAPINTGNVDAQGRQTGDLGFTRMFGGNSPVLLPPAPKPSNWWEQDGATAPTKIPGAPQPSAPSQIDFFKQYGGYEGLLGLKPGTFSTPGSFKLSDMLGIQKTPPVDQGLQYGPQTATNNMANKFAGLINNGQPAGSPLSPQNIDMNKKGPKLT